MIVSPSILSCDFSQLRKSIEEVAPFVDYIHIDVMDGVFVPNISIGLPVIKSIRNHFKDLVFDVHLMIIDPYKYISDFVKVGSDIITIHYEANSDLVKTINLIKKNNVKAGISIKPNTKVSEIKEYLEMVDLVLVMSVEPGFGGQTFIESSLEKIKELHQLKLSNNYNYIIEVDGGVNDQTINKLKEANAEMVVSGSYIFDSANKEDCINKLK